MSILLGVLQVTGKGGNELFVFDDALVRAATGLGAALFGALDGSKGPAAVKRAVASAEDHSGDTPEEIAQQSKGNVLVWTRNLERAVLTKGRWPGVGLRRLTLTAVGGDSLVFSWPGDGATRPLNHDEYAISLLSRALPDVLDVQL
jgi:hypothetical protein